MKGMVGPPLANVKAAGPVVAAQFEIFATDIGWRTPRQAAVKLRGS